MLMDVRPAKGPNHGESLEGTIKPHSIPEGPWETISVDLIWEVAPIQRLQWYMHHCRMLLQTGVPNPYLHDSHW